MSKTNQTKIYERNNSGNDETWVVSHSVHASLSAANPRKVDGDERGKLGGHKPLSPGGHYAKWSRPPFRGAVRPAVYVERNDRRQPNHKGTLVNLPAPVPHCASKPSKQSIHLPVCGPNVVGFAMPSGFSVGCYKPCNFARMYPSS